MDLLDRRPLQPMPTPSEVVSVTIPHPPHRVAPSFILFDLFTFVLSLSLYWSSRTRTKHNIDIVDNSRMCVYISFYLHIISVPCSGIYKLVSAFEPGGGTFSNQSYKSNKWPLSRLDYKWATIEDEQVHLLKRYRWKMEIKTISDDMHCALKKCY